MAKQNLGTVEAVSTMSATDSVLVEIGGSIRRITLTEFTEAIQTGGLSLRLFAWGVPIKQSVQSSPDWGRVGNLDMWEAFKGQCGRYLLSEDGSKMAKLAKNDSSVFADGTALDESKGHVMFYGPRIYYLVREDETDGVPYLWMSQFPISANYIEAPIVGAYKASLASGNKLTSRSGVSTLTETTITNFWNYAQNNGEDFGLADYDFHRYLMMLQLSEFGTPDCQSTVGYGICGNTGDGWGADTNLYETGATIYLGDNCGKIDITPQKEAVTDASRVNFFGVEDRWGWQYEMLQGIYCGSSNNDEQDGTEVFIYKGNRLPTSDERATHPNGEYRQLTRITTGSWLYAKEMALGEFFDLIMTVSGGTSSTYWCDAQYGSATGQLVSAGPYTYPGACIGLGTLISNNRWSNTNTYNGARLAFYGSTPKIVNGADM